MRGGRSVSSSWNGVRSTIRRVTQRLWLALLGLMASVVYFIPYMCQKTNSLYSYAFLRYRVLWCNHEYRQASDARGHSRFGGGFDITTPAIRPLKHVAYETHSLMDPVQGYPAVEFRMQIAGPSSGACGVRLKHRSKRAMRTVETMSVIEGEGNFLLPRKSNKAVEQPHCWRGVTRTKTKVTIDIAKICYPFYIYSKEITGIPPRHPACRDRRNSVKR